MREHAINFARNGWDGLVDEMLDPKAQFPIIKGQVRPGYHSSHPEEEGFDEEGEAQAIANTQSPYNRGAHQDFLNRMSDPQGQSRQDPDEATQRRIEEREDEHKNAPYETKFRPPDTGSGKHKAPAYKENPFLGGKEPKNFLGKHEADIKAERDELEALKARHEANRFKPPKYDPYEDEDPNLDGDVAHPFLDKKGNRARSGAPQGAVPPSNSPFVSNPADDFEDGTSEQGDPFGVGNFNPFGGKGYLPQAQTGQPGVPAIKRRDAPQIANSFLNQYNQTQNDEAKYDDEVSPGKLSPTDYKAMRDQEVQNQKDLKDARDKKLKDFDSKLLDPSYSIAPEQGISGTYPETETEYNDIKKRRQEERLSKNPNGNLKNRESQRYSDAQGETDSAHKLFPSDLYDPSYQNSKENPFMYPQTKAEYDEEVKSRNQQRHRLEPTGNIKNRESDRYAQRQTDEGTLRGLFDNDILAPSYSYDEKNMPASYGETKSEFEGIQEKRRKAREGQDQSLVGRNREEARNTQLDGEEAEAHGKFDEGLLGPSVSYQPGAVLEYPETKAEYHNALAKREKRRQQQEEEREEYEKSQRGYGKFDQGLLNPTFSSGPEASMGYDETDDEYNDMLSHRNQKNQEQIEASGDFEMPEPNFRPRRPKQRPRTGRPQFVPPIPNDEDSPLVGPAEQGETPDLMSFEGEPPATGGFTDGAEGDDTFGINAFRAQPPRPQASLADDEPANPDGGQNAEANSLINKMRQQQGFLDDDDTQRLLELDPNAFNETMMEYHQPSGGPISIEGSREKILKNIPLSQEELEQYRQEDPDGLQKTFLEASYNTDDVEGWREGEKQAYETRRNNSPMPRRGGPPDDYDPDDPDQYEAVDADGWEGQPRYPINKYGGRNPRMQQFQGGSYLPQGPNGWGSTPPPPGSTSAMNGKAIGEFASNLAGVVDPLAAAVNTFDKGADAIGKVVNIGKDLFDVEGMRQRKREQDAERVSARELEQAELLRDKHLRQSEKSRRKRLMQEAADRGALKEAIEKDQDRVARSKQYGQTNAYGTVDWEGNAADGTRRLVSKLDDYQQSKKDNAKRLADELTAQDAGEKVAAAVQEKIMAQWHRNNDARMESEKDKLETSLFQKGIAVGSPGYLKAMKNLADSHEKERVNAEDHSAEMGHKYGNEAFEQKLKVYEDMDKFVDPLDQYKGTSDIGTDAYKDSVLASAEHVGKRSDAEVGFRQKEQEHALDIQKQRQKQQLGEKELRSKYQLEDLRHRYTNDEKRREYEHDIKVNTAKMYHDAGMQSSRLENESYDHWQERLAKKEIAMKEIDSLERRDRERYGHETRLQEGKQSWESEEQYLKRKHEDRTNIRQHGFLAGESAIERRYKLAFERERRADESKEKYKQRMHDLDIQQGKQDWESDEKYLERLHEDRTNIRQHGFLAGESALERKYKLSYERERRADESRDKYRQRMHDLDLQQGKQDWESEEKYLDRQSTDRRDIRQHGFLAGESSKERQFKLSHSREQREGESRENYAKRMYELDLQEGKQDWESREAYLKRLSDDRRDIIHHDFLAGESAKDRKLKVEYGREQRADESREAYRKRMHELDLLEGKQDWESQEGYLKRRAEDRRDMRSHGFQAGESAKDRAYRLAFEREKRSDESDEHYRQRMHDLNVLEKEHGFRAGETQTQREYDAREAAQRRKHETREQHLTRITNQELQRQRLEQEAGLHYDDRYDKKSERAYDREFEKDRDIYRYGQEKDRDLLKYRQEKELLKEKYGYDKEDKNDKYAHEQWIKKQDIAEKRRAEAKLYKEEDRRLKNKLESDRSLSEIEFARKDRHAREMLKKEHEYNQELKRLDHEQMVAIRNLEQKHKMGLLGSEHKYELAKVEHEFNLKRDRVKEILGYTRSVFDMGYDMYQAQTGRIEAREHGVHNRNSEYETARHNRRSEDIEHAHNMRTEATENYALYNDPTNFESQGVLHNIWDWTFGTEAKKKHDPSWFAGLGHDDK
jgi:hypothetical protein